MNATTTITTIRGTSWPLAATHPPCAKPGPTWAEWSAAQAQRAVRRQRYGELPFSDRELARLAFLRWLFQTEHIIP